jgi:hypothetical protein
MVSPIGKSSSFKEEEASKPKEKEKVVEPPPFPSQSVPLKEKTSNGDAASAEGEATSTEGVEVSALELLQQEVRAAKFFVELLGVRGAEVEAEKAIQQEPVAALENGMSTDHRCIWIPTDILTHLMLRSSTQRFQTAISKFQNVYEQIEKELWRKQLIYELMHIALLFRRPFYDETRRHRHIETDFRDTAMWCCPISQYGCCKRLLYYMLHIPAEWREQVEELVVAMKALPAAQAELMSWEMLELLGPRYYRGLRHIHMRHKEEDLLMKIAVGKEERYVRTESTDSDSYSTY